MPCKYLYSISGFLFPERRFSKAAGRALGPVGLPPGDVFTETHEVLVIIHMASASIVLCYSVAEAVTNPAGARIGNLVMTSRIMILSCMLEMSALSCVEVSDTASPAITFKLDPQAMQDGQG